jgi:DNA polymerase III epsilon subunit-like protein
MQVASFSLRPDYISHDNILEDWYILCAAWKWQGEKKIYGEVSQGAHDDKNVVEALREAIIEADELVYHNGRKFDWKKLNTRVVLNGIAPMMKPREVDTLIQVRKHFGFTSNRLDYIGKVLGVGGKLHTGNDLWLKALRRDEQALKDMFKYCKRDVQVLEDVYLKLAPYIDVGYNKNIDSLDVLRCPSCRSDHYQHRGHAYTKTGRYKRYQCQKCLRWFQDGKKEPTAGIVHR